MKKAARAVLSAAGIDAGKDFDQLSSDQLAAIHAEAAAAYQRKYRKPISNSSATYVRRRYELLQQRAYR